MKSAKVITKMLSGKGVKTMAGVNILPIPSVYVPLSELKGGKTFIMETMVSYSYETRKPDESSLR